MAASRRLFASWLIVATGCCLACSFAGCRSHPNFHFPTILPEGSTKQQQMIGNQFDPYPDPDVGPPVVGGRPRDYQKPVAEPQRARWNWEALNPVNWFH